MAWEVVAQVFVLLDNRKGGCGTCTFLEVEEIREGHVEEGRKWRGGRGRKAAGRKGRVRSPDLNSYREGIAGSRNGYGEAVSVWIWHIYRRSRRVFRSQK